MALTRAQKTRTIRQQALREQLSAQCHVQHLTDALTNMQQLAEGEIDQEAKDRFSMYAALADRHWKIVDKYLPVTSNSGTSLVEVLSSMPLTETDKMIERVLADQSDQN